MNNDMTSPTLKENSYWISLFCLTSVTEINYLYLCRPSFLTPVQSLFAKLGHKSSHNCKSHTNKPQKDQFLCSPRSSPSPGLAQCWWSRGWAGEYNGRKLPRNNVTPNLPIVIIFMIRVHIVNYLLHSPGLIMWAHYPKIGTFLS